MHENRMNQFQVTILPGAPGLPSSPALPCKITAVIFNHWSCSSHPTVHPLTGVPGFPEGPTGPGAPCSPLSPAKPC